MILDRALRRFPMVWVSKKLYNFMANQVRDLLVYDTKKKARYTKIDHIKLLLAASLINGFAEGVSKSIQKSLTGETLLSYIKSQGQIELEMTFNDLVSRNVRILKRRRKLLNKVPIALDWHDVMYYGDPDTHMVLGTQHKNGSNYAYEYLTGSVLVDGQRLIVAVMPIHAKIEVSRLTRCILQKIQNLGIKIEYITLDGGFFSTDNIRFLENSKLKYIIHMPSNSRTKKMKLWDGRQFQYTTSGHHVRKCDQVTFRVTVAYDKAKKYKYLFATNILYKSDTTLDLFNKRWGIETSYRVSNQFLIKTTSRDYMIRLFYYLFACIVYNAWIIHNDPEQYTVVQMKLILIGFIMNNDVLEIKDS